MLCSLDEEIRASISLLSVPILDGAFDIRKKVTTYFYYCLANMGEGYS